MTIDENGRIYVGASADLGYLDQDEKGELKFVSLLDYIDDSDKVFSYVWTTIATEDGIYFQTFERIFLFTPTSQSQSGEGKSDWDVKVWNATVKFYYAWWLNGNYYVQQGGVGFMKMENDSLVLLPDGERFMNDRLQGNLLLEPYKVLDLTEGGFMISGKILADLGADVIKICLEGKRKGQRRKNKRGCFYKNICEGVFVPDQELQQTSIY